MAEAEDTGKYKFSPKSASVSELPAPPWADAAEQVYRFRAGGQIAAIALGGGLKVTDLKWDESDLAHGSET